MSYDRVNPPNLKSLERIKTWHDAALSIFDEMLTTARENLAKRNYNVRNAAVHRKYWREFMQWQLGISWQVAEEIEQSLLSARKIRVFGGYAVRYKEGKKQ